MWVVFSEMCMPDVCALEGLAVLEGFFSMCVETVDASGKPRTILLFFFFDMFLYFTYVFHEIEQSSNGGPRCMENERTCYSTRKFSQASYETAGT